VQLIILHDGLARLTGHRLDGWGLQQDSLARRVEIKVIQHLQRAGLASAFQG
jgi:hypothetical protein